MCVCVCVCVCLYINAPPKAKVNMPTINVIWCLNHRICNRTPVLIWIQTFDTLIVFLKEFFEKNYENQQKKHEGVNYRSLRAYKVQYGGAFVRGTWFHAVIIT